MREMSNQNFENNGVNGTRPLGEGSSLNEDMVENESESVAEEIINVEELNDNVIDVLITQHIIGTMNLGKLLNDKMKKCWKEKQMMALCLRK